MNHLQQRLIVVFVVGWVAYAATYFLRKPLGVVSIFQFKKSTPRILASKIENLKKIKSDMEAELGFTKAQLGLFDSALLLPYALVQVSGLKSNFN
jgi:sugar phosphate permease